MKTINQYLDALLSLPSERKTETATRAIKNLQELKLSGISGNETLRNETLKRVIEKELR